MGGYERTYHHIISSCRLAAVAAIAWLDGKGQGVLFDLFGRAGWQDGRMAWWLRLWGLVWSTLWIRGISASMMCLGMGYIMFLLQFISIHGRSMGKMTIRIHKISEGMEQGFPIIFGQAHATIPGEEISFEKQVPLLQKVVRIHLPTLSTHMGLSENFGENGGKPWKTTHNPMVCHHFP